LDISRRKFFFFGLAAGVGLLLPDKKILSYEDSREAAIARIKKMTKEAMDEYRREIDRQLCGIPYHQSNYSTGVWLGFSRT